MRYVAPQGKYYRKIGDTENNYAIAITPAGNDSIDNYELVDKPVPVDEELEKAKENKRAEISKACNLAIENGLDIDNEHFSFKLEDQSNFNMLLRGIDNGMTIVPYQSDYGDCTAYTAEEFKALYDALSQNVLYQRSYHNQLKKYVNRCETVEEVNAITYGMALPVDLQNHLNEVLGLV